MSPAMGGCRPGPSSPRATAHRLPHGRLLTSWQLLASHEEGGFTVTVPALPGIVTQGETVEDALEMARDAISLYLQDLVADGEEIPTRQRRRGC